MKRSDRPRGRALRTIVLLVLGGASVDVFAQATSITPSGLNTATPALNSTTTAITGGTRSGANLFHSFGDFSVGQGHTALFQNSDGGATSNIFGRVTGGNESRIFGTIDSASNFPTANLWLINPNGFLFGPTATLNVGGSVNISTADYLRMADGNKFFADPAKTSVLSMEPVQAFGFLGVNPGGAITIQGGTVNHASALTLVGRDIVDGHHNTVTPGLVITGGTLETSGSSVNLVSVRTPQDTSRGSEILVGDLSPASGQGFSELGTVQLDSGAVLSTTSMAGRTGSVFVRARDLVLRDDAIISTQPTSTVPAGSITVNVDNFWAFNNAHILSGPVRDSDSPNTGSPGSITIQGVGGAGSAARSVSLSKNSTIESSAVGITASGPLTITAHVLSLTDSLITSSSSNNSFNNDGAGANVRLNVGTLTAQTSAIQSLSTGTGNAGAVFIGGIDGLNGSGSLAGDLTLRGATVESSNSGVGDAGNIQLMATKSIFVRNSAVLTQTFQGGGGNIKLTAPNTILITDSLLRSSIPGQVGSSAGNISVDPVAVVIQNSSILVQANAGGGNSLIVGDVVLIDPNSTVNASGSVQLRGGVGTEAFAKPLVQFKLSYGAVALSADRCAADPQGRFSSFVQTGRDGVPTIPGSYAPSPLLVLDQLLSSVRGSQSVNVTARRLGFDSVGSSSFRFQSACRS